MKEVFKIFEDYVITKHAIQRYAERLEYNRQDIIRRIKSDLYFTKVRRIINEGNIRHVFTTCGKEFIFKKDNIWVLTTVIKRTRNHNKHKIAFLERSLNLATI